MTIDKLTFNKHIIKKSFSRAASTYDTWSGFQSDVAEDLLNLQRKINVFPDRGGPHLALDIGCGTGALVCSIKDRDRDVNLFGCDFSHPMLVKAEENLQGRNVRLISSDCEYLPFVGSLFRLVTSSLTYQWVPNIAGAFLEVWRILKPDGYFLFSTLGPRTLEELRKSYQKTKDMPDGNELPVYMVPHETEGLSSLLKKVGFETLAIERIYKKKHYRDLWDLLKTLKATGASPSFPNGNKKGLAIGLPLKEAAKEYQKHFSASSGNGIIATYDIIYAAAQKI